MDYRKFAALSPEEQDELLADSLDRLANEDLVLADTLIRHEYHGHSMREVAEATGVTKPAVLKRLRRARNRLEQLMEEALNDRKAAS